MIGLPDDTWGEAVSAAVVLKSGTLELAELRDWFKALYQTLLGADQGPRMGSFIALYGIDNSRKLIAQALAA